MAATLKLLACQIEIPKTRNTGACLDNVKRTVEIIEKRLSDEPDISLIVLPELSTIEYSRSAFEKLACCYEDIGRNAAEIYRQLSEQYGCAVCYGFARRDGENVHISQAVVRPNDAEVLLYDKIHLAHLGDCTEKDFFQPGSNLCVFELSGFRIAIVICYDFRFSPLTNRLSKEYGIDLFLHPVAFSRDATFPSWHPFVIARAIEHQAYFLSLNRAGSNWGKSVFCPPWLDSQYQLCTFSEAEEFQVLSLYSDELRMIRSQFPLKSDALVDYGKLQANLP